MGLLSKIFGNTRKPEGFFGRLMVAGVYDLFANFYNAGTHRVLCQEVASFEHADILHLDYPDESFDKVVAANVIHLLDEPLKALSELDRVCRKGGRIIIPTYMNCEKREGKTSGFAAAVGKAGADFKRQFTFSSYLQFFFSGSFVYSTSPRTAKYRQITPMM